MRSSQHFAAWALGLCLALPSPCVAQDAGGDSSPTSPPESSVEVSGGVALVSDYRFRGLSLTDRRPALQGYVTAAHDSGFHASLWGSTVRGYVRAGADAEIDLSAGYRHSFGGTTLDGGLLYYVFPGSRGRTNFVEPYASVAHTLGPVTAKLSAAYAPSQRALGAGGVAKDNLYLAGDLSAAVIGTPVGLAAHLGHSFGSSRLAPGRSYSDWGLSANYTMRSVTLGLGYADTDTRLIAPRGRNAGGAGVVASAGLAF